MSALLYFFLSLCLVVAQDNRPPDPNNYFIYPPLPGPQYSNDPTVFASNINFTVGKPQSQPFKWQSNMTNMQIILCQEGNPESVQQHPLTGCFDGSSSDSLYWDGDIGSIDLDNGSQAYLGVWNCSEISTPVFFSHYMNLVEAPPPQSSSASSSTTQTSTSSALLPTSVVTSPTPTAETLSASPPSTSIPATSNSSPPPSGPSNAAVIGAGIGGGLGGALLLIIAAFAFWKYRNRKRNNTPQEQVQPTWVNQSYNTMPLSPEVNWYKPYQPAEILTRSSMVPELSPSVNNEAGSGSRRPVYEMPIAR